jgi:Protein of unknown function (DUF692)
MALPPADRDRRLLPPTAAPLGPDPAAIPAQAGIGLRFPHHAAVLELRPKIAWLEVHTENYMGGGKPIATLEAIRARYPIALRMSPNASSRPSSPSTCRGASSTAAISPTSYRCR